MAKAERICSDDNCNRPTHARGLCSKHYKRLYKKALPLPPKARVRGECMIEGCAKPHNSHGYCQMHYVRWRRHGDPLFTKTAPEGEGLAFLHSLIGHEGGDCITWPYCKNPQGYGQTFYCGEVMGAHRVMCILAHGEPPTPKHQAAHSCGRGTDGCVNPAHLRWATCKENIADKFQLHGWSLIKGDDGRIVGHVRA